MKRSLLEARAGPRALAAIRRYGFSPSRLAAYVGPASGPRWLVLAGIDRALVGAGLVAPRAADPLLLVGASAGAWRMLALASPDPHGTLTRLAEGYIAQTFHRQARPDEVSAAYRALLQEVFPPATAAAIVDHPGCDVAVRVARARGLAAVDVRPALLAGLALALLLHRATRRGLSLFFQRVLLHSAPPRYRGDPPAALGRLGAGNLVDAALASGSVPLYMSAVRRITGLPAGRYRDGGLTDYHLAGRVTSGETGITLLVHHQAEILPLWFDKGSGAGGRLATALEDVLVLHPTPELIALLPGGKLPDRQDFVTWAEQPEERRRRWRQAAALGDLLGEELERDLSSGAFADRVQPLPYELVPAGAAGAAPRTAALNRSP